MSIYFNHLHLSGIALASSLVTLGNPRKASVDPTQKVVLSTFIVLSAFVVPFAIAALSACQLKYECITTHYFLGGADRSKFKTSEKSKGGCFLSANFSTQSES